MRRRGGAVGCAASLLIAAALAAQVPEPLPVDILQTSSALADGYLFIAPTGPGGLTPLPDAVQGAEILDSQGRPVWFFEPPNNQLAADFRVQTYQGSPVLTYAQGPGFEDTAVGATTDYILDTSYRVVATVQAGDNLNADEHEFQLTPQNTALVTIYNAVPYDLSAVGGPADGTVMEGVAEEIDIASGTVVFEWHSLAHVALSESEMPAPTTAGIPYDYFHINSVKLDTDGNLLISSRNCSAVYKVNRSTGQVIWRLGGKLSDYALGPGLPFAYQHDVEAVDSQTLRIFDNESDGAAVLPASRVLWITHDDTAMTATIKQSLQHPDGISVYAEGNAQALDNGDTLVDWGIVGRYSEFDPSGNLLYDVTLPSGYSNYRAFRLAWSATPVTLPAAAVEYAPSGTATVHAIWNGATAVATWQVLGGSSPSALTVLATAPWNGLDTAVALASQPAFLQVVALDGTGATLASSAVTGGTPTFTAEPAAQTVASGRSVVLSAPAAGSGAVTYQWYDNGQPLSDGSAGGVAVAGATGPTLFLDGVGAASAGTYTCVATDGGGSTTSAGAVLTVASTADVGRLVNVSTRAEVGTGQDILITGFEIGGGGTGSDESLLIRASGPALSSYGVNEVLPDPSLAIASISGATSQLPLDLDAGQAALVAATAAEVGAFAWPNGDTADEAQVISLAPGAYTAEVSGASGDTGVALAEVFDATPAGTYAPTLPRLVNVSARVAVGSGGDVLIAGFVIGGSTSETVLVRASGPALAAYGVTGVLADPQLQVYGASGAIPLAANTGWGGNTEIAAVADEVGAFPWTSAGSADSALLLTLPPGAYTAEVAGASGDGGVALIEVYEVQ